MPKPLKLITLVLLLISGPAFAQLELSHAPRDRAFLARDRDTNICSYTLKGKVTDWSYNRLEVNTYKDGKFDRKYLPYLRYSGGERKFEQVIQLPAGRHFCSIEYVLVGATNHTMQVDSLLVGDVYLVQGQSNAVAGDYRRTEATAFDSTYYSPFLRSFGTSSPNWNLSSTDSGWYDLEASLYYTKGAVGEWAAVMARVILDSFEMPVCLMNGAVGGTPITYHVPDNNDHYSIITNYGRLLTRTRMADLQDRIKGIFYFQGESDGSNAMGHDTLFREIVEAWDKDYAGFEKLYVIQVRAGCGSPSLELRDVQRKFGKTIEKCQTVSANGLNGHDGCHYNFKDGYELLGHQLAAIAGRDHYHSGKKNVDPPNIAAALYQNSDRNTIRLVMENPEDIVLVDPGFYTLFKVEGDPNVSIVGGTVKFNQVILQLSQSSCSDLYLSYDGYVQVRPWVKNQTLMGLPSFYRIPVQSVVAAQELFACKGDYITLGDPALPGYSYQWKNLTSGASSINAQWMVRADVTTKYRLICSYTNTVCSGADTLYFMVHADSIKIPSFNDEYVLCSNESVWLEPDTSNWKMFEWNTVRSWNNRVDTTEKIQWTGLSDAGCIYTDSFASRSVQPRVGIEDSIMVCDKMMLTIHLSGFDKYYWNGTQGDSFYTTGAGELDIVVEKEGCWDSTHVSITEYPKPIQPDWHFEVCANETLWLFQPDEIIQWSIDGNVQLSQIVVTEEGTKEIAWWDSLLCMYQDTLVRVNKPFPQTEELTDTGFCPDDSLAVYVGPENYTYNWTDSAGDMNQRTLVHSGLYAVEVSDTNACHIRWDFVVEEWQRPSLDAFRDTVLCRDSMWDLDLEDGVIFSINGIIMINSATLLPDSTYTVYAVNDHCKNAKTIRIESEDCNVHVQPVDLARVSVYPNPVKQFQELRIESDQPVESILLIDELGREIQSQTGETKRFKIGTPGVFYLAVFFQNGESVHKTILVY